jgi:2-dehydropantoate 2-reductase
MKIAVIGVGGIGAYYVARLMESGHDVLVVARGEHLRAMKSTGLRVDHPEKAFSAPVDALDLEELESRDPRELDLIVLLTKATATNDIAGSLATWLGETAVPVLSLQNGVDNEAVLAEALGERRVIGGYSVRLGGCIVAPGHVECVGAGEAWVGVWPDEGAGDAQRRRLVEGIAQAFNEAGLPTRVSEDVRREMWRKLVLNNAVNPLSALLEWDTARLSHDPGIAPLVRDIMDETVAVGRADGVALSSADADEMLALIRGFAAIKTSMLVDLERGRELELDAISGAVLERARRLGVEAPCTRAVAALLKAKLTGARFHLSTTDIQKR